MMKNLVLAGGVLLTVSMSAHAQHAHHPGATPAIATDDAFIFSSTGVTSAPDSRQALRLNERLSLAEIKRRLPSYLVEKSHECEGDCIHVSGKNGVYLELQHVPLIVGHSLNA